MVSPMSESPLQDETYLPTEDAAEIIDFLSAMRARGRQMAVARPRLVGPDGRRVEVPESVFGVLLQVAAAMKAGLAVTVAPNRLSLTTQEAADLLRVSRTTLVRLLVTGAIPFEKPNRHRRVRLDDLLEYRRRQRSAAELALADMIADTERLGLRHRPRRRQSCAKGRTEEVRSVTVALLGTCAGVQPCSRPNACLRALVTPGRAPRRRVPR